LTFRIDVQIRKVIQQRIEQRHGVWAETASDAEIDVEPSAGNLFQVAECFLGVEGLALAAARIDENVVDHSDRTAVVTDHVSELLWVVVDFLQRMTTDLQDETLFPVSRRVELLDLAHVRPRDVELEAVEIRTIHVREFDELFRQRLRLIRVVVNEVDRAFVSLEDLVRVELLFLEQLGNPAVDFRITARPLVDLADERLGTDEHTHHELAV